MTNDCKHDTLLVSREKLYWRFMKTILMNCENCIQNTLLLNVSFWLKIRFQFFPELQLYRKAGANFDVTPKKFCFFVLKVLLCVDYLHMKFRSNFVQL